MHSSSQTGAVGIIIALLVAVAAIGGGYYVWQQRATVPLVTSSPGLPITPAITTAVTTSTPAASTFTQHQSDGAGFTGTRLAGTTAPLLDFTSADYQAALASDKLIVLYFYANWCPICREEFPKMAAAFNQLTLPNVVGFRVNYNDNETDPAEQALAREHGVAYQHTKVFVRGGQRVSKSPEMWTQERYVADITAAAR